MQDASCLRCDVPLKVQEIGRVHRGEEVAYVEVDLGHDTLGFYLCPHCKEGQMNFLRQIREMV